MKHSIIFSLIVLIITAAPSLTWAKLKGKVIIDGSSTVFPITEAIAEEYRNEEPRVRVIVGVSGTGGGFKKFIAGSIDINDASRTIKDKEIKKAKKVGISYFEIPVAYDGITVVINKENTWATSITVKELNKIWKSGSTVKTWKDVRESWPDKKIKLYGPGTDSGTFDYFTKAINGKSHSSRANYTMSEDDNVLVTGVKSNKYAMGYFGYSYYKENKDKLKALPIDSINGIVSPTVKTINDGSYHPLSRPIFIYVSRNSLKKLQVKSFVSFYMKKAAEIVEEVGYVPLSKNDYKKSLDQVNK